MAIAQALPSPASTPPPKNADMEGRHSTPTLRVSSPNGRHDLKIDDVDLPLSPSPSPNPVEHRGSTHPFPVTILKSKNATVVVTAPVDEPRLSPRTDDAVSTSQHHSNEQTQPSSSGSPSQSVHFTPTQRSALLTGPTVPIVVGNQTLFPAVSKALLTHFSRKAAFMFNTHNATSMTFTTSIHPSVLKYIIHHLLATCSSSGPPPAVYTGHLDKQLSIYHATRRHLLDIPALSTPLRKSIMATLHSRPLTSAELRFITQKFNKADQLCTVVINKTIDFRIEGNLPDARAIEEYLASVPALEKHFVMLTERKLEMIEEVRIPRRERREAWAVSRKARREMARRRAEGEGREADRGRIWEGTKDVREEDRGRSRQSRRETAGRG